MHEHAQTWSVLKTLYSSPGESGTTASTLGPSTKAALAAGSHGSGGGLSTTGNPEPAAGNGTISFPESSFPLTSGRKTTESSGSNHFRHAP